MKGLFTVFVALLFVLMAVPAMAIAHPATVDHVGV